MSRPEQTQLQRSSRDAESVAARLMSWLRDRVDNPVVTNVRPTSATGVSSDTWLFDAQWDGDRARLVARIAPERDDVPVFPSYDMKLQYDVIRLVGELSSVPVPRLRWLELDERVLGAPFFVMDQVDGVIPPDVLPYVFGDNWLFDATAEQQHSLQDASVRVLAELHAIERSAEQFHFAGYTDPGATPLARHVAHRRAWYEFVVANGQRSPLIERGFDWVDANFPADEGVAVLSWGDARIGNIIFRDFVPQAVLDWEMVGIGPRELDLAWLINAHCVFQDIATSYDLPGMPDFLQRDDVAAAYESLTGYQPRDLDFYLTYASVQWAIVFVRAGQRSVHFGERDMPANIEDLIMNREPLTRMLAGEYWK